MTTLIQAALLLGVFAVVTLIAELAGAANLGTAMGIGQIAFAIALVALLLVRRPAPPADPPPRKSPRAPPKRRRR